MFAGSIKGLSMTLASVVSLLGCNLQYNMLYYPSSYVPSRAELAASNIEFWPSGPAGYRGFIGTTETGNIKGTVIVFHGNAGTAADRVYYVQALGSIGYRVILAEYPKYGQRGGELGEASLVTDAKESVRLAAEKYGGPLYLLGESIGCGVAAGVAGGPHPADRRPPPHHPMGSARDGGQDPFSVAADGPAPEGPL